MPIKPLGDSIYHMEMVTEVKLSQDRSKKILENYQGSQKDSKNSKKPCKGGLKPLVVKGTGYSKIMRASEGKRKLSFAMPMAKR